MQNGARYLFIFTWALVSVISVSLLHSSHVFNPDPKGRWVLTHIIDPLDPQNQKIENYLLGRSAVTVFDELVILLEPDSELREKLRHQGYFVSFGNRQTVFKNMANLQTPYFLVTSPRGEGVYAGAYTEKIEDLRIAQSYFSHQTLSDFPISGCGNSVRAQKVFDPQTLILTQRGDP